MDIIAQYSLHYIEIHFPYSYFRAASIFNLNMYLICVCSSRQILVSLARLLKKKMFGLMEGVGCAR